MSESPVWYKLTNSVPTELELLKSDVIISNLKQIDFGRYVCEWKEFNQTRQYQVLLEKEGILD
jgi:hypothetical protein